MKPKDITVARSPPSEPSRPNAASRVARSSCTFRLEVSITRSASPRSSRSRSRSRPMPSVIRPSPCSGCGRRTFSKRRTSTSSADSRKTMRCRSPVASMCSSASCRCSKKDRPRTSTTTAMRGTEPWVRAARSTIVAIRLGGRLSTTNQPRSSRTFAAVDRPAPDMPEITTSSGGSLAASCSSPFILDRLSPGQLFPWAVPSVARRRPCQSLCPFRISFRHLPEAPPSPC